MVDDARTDDARTVLRDWLGELPALEALSDEQAEELLHAIRVAGRGHREKMRAAQERSLGHIPALLRPGVRKVLGV
ncbi:hypothetical protein [Haloechinothrix sp. LS1_15]|uniref:hypothetical protein n=1 Tax=Haloechinothrix sp. LS1_15 TaxID=2652248 RepID=UPI0029470149|nr:hypothetical protein [Haloechinothrix sp. LS1_15]MDV6014746.1 hypothetical protein [Haloechinothrix sp. LS1_15]